jgi:hypothetical protein
MQWDAVTDQWVWFAAAGVLLLSIAVYAAATSYRSKAYDPKPKSQSSTHSQKDGWTPTGRIDFGGPESSGDFFLQVEDTRTVSSVGGVEHREIRWRRPTLDEVKGVVVSYHAQRNLTTAPSYVVSSSTGMRPRNSDMRNEHADAGIAKDQVAEEKPEGRLIKDT